MSPRRAIIPVFIPHLGCPCRCVFCNQNSITSVDDQNAFVTTKSMPSPSLIGRLIEEGIKKSGGGAELAFYGGSFTAICPDLMRSYLEAAHPFVAGGLIDGIRVSTRPDAIEADTLDQLRYFGVRTIEIGAQSMDDRVLELSKRGHTAADTEKAARLIREKGFSLILQMMVGLPGETPGSPMSTAQRLADLRPDGVRIYPTAVIRGTELELMWKKGEYTPLPFEQAVEICAGLIAFFDSKEISILRVGLNPSEDLSGEIVAGIYHPAFGDFCRSRLVYEAARQLLTNAIEDGLQTEGKTAVFGTGGRHLSLLVGQRRSNIKRLIEVFGFEGISVVDTDKVSASFEAHDFRSKDGWLPVNRSAAAKGTQVLVEFLGIY